MLRVDHAFFKHVQRALHVKFDGTEFSILRGPSHQIRGVVVSRPAVAIVCLAVNLMVELACHSGGSCHVSLISSAAKDVDLMGEMERGLLAA